MTKRPEPPPSPTSLPEIHRAELESILSEALDRVRAGRVRGLVLAIVDDGGFGGSEVGIAGNATLGEVAALALVAHEGAEGATLYYQASRDLGEPVGEDGKPFKGQRSGRSRCLVQLACMASGGGRMRDGRGLTEVETLRLWLAVELEVAPFGGAVEATRVRVLRRRLDDALKAERERAESTEG